MTNVDFEWNEGAVEQAIALAEAALHMCDEHGFLYAAIDLSSAIDKLKAIKAQSGRG